MAKHIDKAIKINAISVSIERRKFFSRPNQGEKEGIEFHAVDFIFCSRENNKVLKQIAQQCTYVKERRVQLE